MEATVTNATFQKYSAYKDSGVEWLGKIPKNWDVLPAKRFHKTKKEINKTRSNDNVLSLTLRGVVNNDLDNPEGLVPKDYATYQLFNENDLVFKLIDLENISTSRVGLVHESGIMSSAYIRLVTGEDTNPKYAYYYYYSLYKNEVFNKLGSGVRSTLGPNDLLNLQFLKPSLEEQTAIAAFLDDKTAKIDRAIAQKEKMITLLKERKQIIIQNAVTKGLDPNAKMKHSGVEWIGEIPEGWEVLPGLRFFKENKRSNKGMKESTVLSLSYGNIIIKPEEKLVGLVPESFETYQIVYPGDIIIRCTDLQNDQTSLRTGLAQNKGIITSAYINLGIIGDNHPEYLHAYLHFVDITKVLYKFGSGLRQNLSFADFKRMPILKVPYNEQVQIVEFIQKASLKIERAIEMQHKEIEKLKELKSTLIDSAVTGKIKVS